MECNQRFFGQQHFEAGTPGRAFCQSLGRLKPALWSGGFARRDQRPPLPADRGGVAQVKYNGMFGVALWDAARGRFVVWSHRGRCYYSLDDGRRHPVTAWLDARADALRDLALLGETHVVRQGPRGAYMTPFNRSMSLIKNPRTAADVDRLRFAVFDWRRRDGQAFVAEPATGVERFGQLRRWDLGAGVDSGLPVHLVDALDCARPLRGRARAPAGLLGRAGRRARVRGRRTRSSTATPWTWPSSPSARWATASSARGAGDASTCWA